MKENEDVIFAKLFYSFGYQGFSKNFETLIEITTSFVLSVCLIYGLFFFLHKLMQNRLGYKTRRQSLLVPKLMAVAISSLLLIFVLALGRQSTLLALKNKLVPYRISKAQPDQTTAILYPRTKLGVLMDLMENNFICAVSEEDKKAKEKVAIDLQLANIIDVMHKEKRSMIWIHGDFFNHIGFFTSLHFKNLHVKTAEFISRYVVLPDIYCNYP